MNLTELTNAWNQLRNAALGRGTAPSVAPALAAVVGVRYERFREELGRAHVEAEYLGLPAWVYAEYNDTLRRVRAALPDAELPPEPAEGPVDAALDKLSDGVATVAVAAAAYLAWRLLKD
jgi:hypothetical protein